MYELGGKAGEAKEESERGRARRNNEMEGRNKARPSFQPKLDSFLLRWIDVVLERRLTEKGVGERERVVWRLGGLVVVGGEEGGEGEVGWASADVGAGLGRSRGVGG